jgi:phage terminase large subunit
MSEPEQPGDEVVRYIEAAHDAGCPDDQCLNFRRLGYMAQPRQLQFHAACRACDRDDGPRQVGFGGARGPGKSHAMLAQIALDDCQRQSRLKALLLRKVGKAVREHMEDLRIKVLRHVEHTYRRSDGAITFPNGSRIVLGHFKDESDIDTYLGLEYDVIGVEEATTLSARKYKAIQSCSRSSKRHWRPRIYSTTNPGGVGHAWYKRTFVDPYEAGEELDTRFIPATVEDNVFIHPDYRNILDSYTGWLKRAWRYGDWDIAAGQFFTTWRQDVHVMEDWKTGRMEDWKNGRMEGSNSTLPLFHSSTLPVFLPSTHPPNWRVWLAMDYGFTHYNVILLLAEDGGGQMYVLDELAEREWLVPRHAEAVRAMLARWEIAPERLATFVAGGDCFASRAVAEGTVADQWAAEGFALEPADDDRINGAAEVLRRLGDPEAGLAPTLHISRACGRLIECLPVLEHDPHRPEDVRKVDTDDDGQGGDDAYDALRYGVMAAATCGRAGGAGLCSEIEMAAFLDSWER